MKKTTLIKTMFLLCALVAGSGSAWADTVVSFSVGDYATTNSWVNGTAYSSITINSDLTATCVTGGNNGKYYTTGNGWKHYESNSGAVTITTTSGVFKSITFSYGKDNNGVLRYGDNEFPSTVKCMEVNGQTSATFTVGHSSGDSKGNVQITQITIIYGESSPTLPFSFDGGIDDITNNVCPAQYGLGEDYKNSPKLKFDTTGDYVLSYFKETPGKLTYDIKGYSFTEGGTFTVQTSVDGSSFSDLKTYTSLSGSKQSEEFNLAANVRYIKWIYTNRSGGNVALGNIKVTLGVTDTENYTPVARDGIDITLKRSFVAGWNGIVLPFDLTNDVKTALGATEVKTLGSASESAGAITLNFTDASLPVAAGTPVLVKLSEAKTNVSIDGVDLKSTAPTTVEKTVVGNTFTLTGTYSEADLSASEVYLVSNNKFYHKKTGDALTAKPFRAYITQTASVGSRLNVFFDLEDGGTTGIHVVNNDEIKDNRFYDLQGRRVAQPTKGLYIVNGRKVIIK